MSDASQRAGDPDDFDPSELRREPVLITIPEAQLRTALTGGAQRAALVAILAGILTAVAVSAAMGFYIAGRVTSVVRHDVGRAAIRNCDHSRTAAGALRRFLTTDAAFNGQLGLLDRRSARIDHDLSQQVRALGRAIPRRIANDYLAQSAVFQELAERRADVSDLWAGRKTKHGRTRSLASSVLAVVEAHCDEILTP